MLVVWIGACQGESKQAEYASYMDKVRAVAVNDRRLGDEFANKLTTPGLKQSAAQTALEQYAQQEQQAYDQAQQIRPPGPLRATHQNLVNAIELRAKGLAGLANAFSSPAAMKDATTAARRSRRRRALLSASDVVWDDLFQLPATRAEERQASPASSSPSSRFISNPDLVTARALTIVFTRLHGASTGGTPSGKHGDQIVSTRATPQGVDLSTSTPTTVKVSVRPRVRGDDRELGRLPGGQHPGDAHDRSRQRIADRVTQAVVVINPQEQKTSPSRTSSCRRARSADRRDHHRRRRRGAGEKNTANNTAELPGHLHARVECARLGA